MQLIKKDNSIVRNLHASLRTGRRTHFTLVEIMVVIVIIAVILGITIPVFNSIATRKSVDAAASMIADSLRLARATAAQKRTEVTLVISVADKGAAYEMRWINPDTDADEVLTDTKKEYLPFGALVKMDSDDIKVTFKSNGCPKDAVDDINIIEAVLNAAKEVQELNTGNVRVVKINRFTGYISVGAG